MPTHLIDAQTLRGISIRNFDNAIVPGFGLSRASLAKSLLAVTPVRTHGVDRA